LFVYSVIDYALPVWGYVSDSNISILQSKINSLLGAFFYPRICNKFQKYNKIAHANENRHHQSISLNYPELWDKCNIVSVAERLKYFCATTAFSAIRFNLVPEMSEKFVLIPSTHKETLSLPSYTTEFAKKSVFYQSALVWNDLSPDCKEIGLTLFKFKRLVNAWLLRKRNKEFVSR
jgi:hypothetical protein